MSLSCFLTGATISWIPQHLVPRIRAVLSMSSVIYPLDSFPLFDSLTLWTGWPFCLLGVVAIFDLGVRTADAREFKTRLVGIVSALVTSALVAWFVYPTAPHVGGFDFGILWYPFLFLSCMAAVRWFLVRKLER